MAKRGVLYLWWGERARAVQARSEASLREHHPELPVHSLQLPETANMLHKARMLMHSPFEETLFLDVDTVVMGRLDFAFDKAARHGLACCINENPWAGRAADPRLQGDMIEYNSGAMFFTRQAQPVFDRWRSLAAGVDSRVRYHMTVDDRVVEDVADGLDQPSLALAIEELGFAPFVLPLNWNFRPKWHVTWYGPIKIWHAYPAPPPAIHAWNADQTRPDRIIKYSQQFLRRRSEPGTGG